MRIFVTVLAEEPSRDSQKAQILKKDRLDILSEMRLNSETEQIQIGNPEKRNY